MLTNRLPIQNLYQRNCRIAVNCRVVNIGHSDVRMFRRPQYNNCYSYMDFLEQTDNIIVGTIASSANFILNTVQPLIIQEAKLVIVIIEDYRKDGRELCPEELVAGYNTWTGQSVLRTYDVMSHEDFCVELNSSAFHQVTPYRYSFPCGEASLEGSDYPFRQLLPRHKTILLIRMD